jgi:hypothetical protein
MKRKRSEAHRILIVELPPEEEGVLRLSWKIASRRGGRLEIVMKIVKIGETFETCVVASRPPGLCDLWRFCFSCAPSQQEEDRGGRWQQQRRSHLSTVKLWYSFSFTVATDHVWIDLCPVPAIEILIFNYQMLSEWKWYYKMSTHRVVCFASV